MRNNTNKLEMMNKTPTKSSSKKTEKRMKEILFDTQSFADSYETSSEVDTLKKKKKKKRTCTQKKRNTNKVFLFKYFEQFSTFVYEHS